ncbi:MAG: hypothetical protein ACFFFH_08365 [Candidatus Thorarchaeota archaeon]
MISLTHKIAKIVGIIPSPKIMACKRWSSTEAAGKTIHNGNN